MPEDLSEGLYLAWVGMGLVFITLVIFLLIMVALRRFFPDEGPSPTSQDEPPGTGDTGQRLPIEVESAPVGLPEPPQAAGGQGYGGLPGAQIAAMAVAAYLSMEQEECAGQSVSVAPALAPSPGESGRSTQSRPHLTRSQGRRPPPYGQKLHSAYSPKGGLS